MVKSNRYSASSMEELHKILVKNNQLFRFRGVIRTEVDTDEYHVVSFDNPSKTPVTLKLSKYLESRYLTNIIEHSLSADEIDLAMVAESTQLRGDNM